MVTAIGLAAGGMRLPEVTVNAGSLDTISKFKTRLTAEHFSCTVRARASCCPLAVHQHAKVFIICPHARNQD